MTLELTLTDLAGGGKPFAGAAVYVWHCTREGEYSLYSPNVRNENFLRGVQVADSAGRCVSPASSPAATPDAGRTSTSRSTPTRRASPTRAARSPPPRSRCRRRPATRCTPRSGYPGVGGNLAGSAWPTTTSSATTAAPASSRRPPGDPGAGFTVGAPPCRWTRPPLRRRAAGRGVVPAPNVRLTSGAALLRASLSSGYGRYARTTARLGSGERLPSKISCTPCSRTTRRNRPYRGRRQPPEPQPARRLRPEPRRDAGRRAGRRRRARARRRKPCQRRAWRADRSSPPRIRAQRPVAAAPAAGPAAAAEPHEPLPRSAPAAVAPPVVLRFGKRSELADGWRLATSRPYLCDVLMAIPVLQKDGTRIMRVTLTLTNRTGAPQATRAVAAGRDRRRGPRRARPVARREFPRRARQDAERGSIGRVPRGDQGAGTPRAGPHHRRARRGAPRRARRHPVVSGVVSGAPGSAGAAPGRPG